MWKVVVGMLLSQVLMLGSAEMLARAQGEPLPTVTVPDIQGLSPDTPIQGPARHDRHASEPDSYCMAGPPLPDQTVRGAYECHCKMICTTPSDNVTTMRVEDPTCEHWCTGERCLCHADQSCDMPSMAPGATTPMFPPDSPFAP